MKKSSLSNPNDRTERKKKKTAHKEETQSKKRSEALSEQELLPIVAFDEELGLGIMEDGTYCDLLEIKTKDLASASEDQLLLDRYAWEKLYMTYAGDLKIISFSFPTDTDEQQQYFRYKADTAEDPVYRRMLREKLHEVQATSQNFPVNSFVLMFFSRTLSEYKNNYMTIKAALARTPALISSLPPEKKKAVFQRLYDKNLNSNE